MDAPFPPDMMACIEEFFAARPNPRLRATASGIDPDVFASSLFFPLQRQRELAWMLSQADAVRPKTVMEIGADKGGGLYHWCMLPSVERVIACEIRGTPYRECFERAFPTIDFLWLDGVSSYRLGTLSKVVEWLEKSIDVLFIDGDKAAMRADYEAYQPWVRPGGLIFVHDVFDAVPGVAFFNLCKEKKLDFQTYVDRKDAREAMKRANLGLAPANPHEEWLRHWKGDSCGVGMIHVRD